MLCRTEISFYSDLTSEGPFHRILRDIRKNLWAFLFTADWLLLLNTFFGNVCVSKLLLGIPCAACGMSRAFMSLLSFDFKRAFLWHPLFLLVIIDAAVFIYANYFNKKANRLFTVVSIAFLVIAFAVYIIRMYCMFPGTAPMDFEEHNLISYIFSQFEAQSQVRIGG